MAAHRQEFFSSAVIACRTNGTTADSRWSASWCVREFKMAFEVGRCGVGISCGRPGGTGRADQKFWPTAQKNTRRVPPAVCLASFWPDQFSGQISGICSKVDIKAPRMLLRWQWSEREHYGSCECTESPFHFHSRLYYTK